MGKKKHLKALLKPNNRQRVPRKFQETLIHTGSSNPQALYGIWRKRLAAFKRKGSGLVDI